MSLSRTTKQLWFLLLLIIASEFIRQKALSATHEKAREAPYAESVHSLKNSGSKGLNREIQSDELNGRLSLFHICRCRSQNTMATYASIRERVNALRGTITTIDVPNSSSVDFFDPPLPIVGTDDANKRNIYAADVVEFAAHVGIWRQVFHGKHGCAIVFSCEVNNMGEVLNALLEENVCENLKLDRGIEREPKPKTWDMLVFGTEREHQRQEYAELSNMREFDRWLSGDMFAYVLNENGANLLLSYTKAYTVPLEVFVGAVITTKKFRVGRSNAARATLSHQCSKQGHAMQSNLLPFYPPLHWTYRASNQISQRKHTTRHLAPPHDASTFKSS